MGLVTAQVVPGTLNTLIYDVTNKHRGQTVFSFIIISSALKAKAFYFEGSCYSEHNFFVLPPKFEPPCGAVRPFSRLTDVTTQLVLILLISISTSCL